jgi:hypothetical protein
MIGLIPPHEEKALFERLIEYYRKLYEGVRFGKDEKTLTREEIGNVLYTYPGEEVDATTDEKMRAIDRALEYGYDTPVVLLEKGNKYILLDGHRRLRVAWKEGLSWKALIIVPSKDVKFGIEKMVLGRIKDLFK